MPRTSATYFPALKDSRWLRLITLALLYVAQGLPIGLFQVAIPAWLASQGLSVAKVASFIAISFLPWSFKLLAGPVMDRFSFPPMGRRRPWVLLAQAGIVLSLLLIAVLEPDPKASFMLLAGLGFCVNSFGAIQDVAVDGMAIDILEEDERAQANAYMYGGQVLGSSGASAIGSFALQNYGLGVAAVLLALVVALIMLVPLMLRERVGERMLPWSEGNASVEALSSVMDNWSIIFSSLFRAVMLPMSLLLMMLEALNRISSGMLTAISPVITVQEINWTAENFSNWTALSGLAAAVFGVLLGSIIDRKGVKRALTIAVIVRILLFVGLSVLQDFWQFDWFFRTCIMINFLSGQIVTIAVIALFMQLCSKKVAATQFAVYMAFANLTLAMGSALVAPMSQVFGYSEMFMVAASLNILLLMLWPFLDMHRHQQDLNKLVG